jgi:hypothetical protein
LPLSPISPSLAGSDLGPSDNLSQVLDMPSSHRRMKGKMIKDTNKSSKVPIKIDYENQEPMMQTRDEFGLPNTS